MFNKTTIIVTGVAGFIGMNVAKKLLDQGNIVVGIDNLNEYYDSSLKRARLAQLLLNINFHFYEADISHTEQIHNIFQTTKPEFVVHFAAQAGVRYSLENPNSYVQSNLVGFANILEACRDIKVNNLIYASSSSVYGANTAVPFSTDCHADFPISLYAATKRSNELMAHAYSHLYNFKTTGIRLFTVYGPWGRPDMALFKFTKLIMGGNEIEIFNHGKHTRDFTYIDDVVDGFLSIIDCGDIHKLQDKNQKMFTSTVAPWRVYNLGSGVPVSLLEFIRCIENAVGKKAKFRMVDYQAGDVERTLADISDFADEFNFKPKVLIKEGVNRFVEWYRDYYK